MGDATKPCIVFIVLSAAYLSSLLGVYYVMFCEYCTEFTGLDCTLPAQCDVYMCPVSSLHYCHRNVLCTFLLCCTTASTACYVCFIHVTLLPAMVLCMSCFVLHYCQRSVPCMSCLCCSTASAVYYVCLVCVALLPVQGAMYVLFVFALLPARGAMYVLFVFVLLPAQCAAVEHCKCSVPLLNTASAVCHC